MPLDVQFYNYSIGNIITYEWDFDNDGIVDSYEQSPVYTYVDTGWNSVNLTIYDGVDSNSFLRENYIYVYELTSTEGHSINSFDISCYPNPFADKVTFSFHTNNLVDENEIIIYDLNGKIVNKLSSIDNEILWDGTNHFGEECKPGLYIVNYKKQNITQKILLTY